MTPTQIAVEALEKALGMLEHASVSLDWSEEEAQHAQSLWDGDVAEIRAALTALRSEGEASFQSRVQPWMMACFGPEISADRVERSDRFIEEALELVQAGGYTKDRAHALVDYVFGRPQGEINQEVGGVMVTLAAHCLAHGIDMHAAAEAELARIWTKVDAIRAKQAAKPTGSALPVPAPPRTEELALPDG
jgi:NTP pyrophosphatase (non-canonical NTP hydrolase)